MNGHSMGSDNDELGARLDENAKHVEKVLVESARAAHDVVEPGRRIVPGHTLTEHLKNEALVESLPHPLGDLVAQLPAQKFPKFAPPPFTFDPPLRLG